MTDAGAPRPAAHPDRAPSSPSPPDADGPPHDAGARRLARASILVVLAATVGLALAALAALSVQLRMGRTIGFSLAVLWGLVALAASTVTVNAALATLAVLAIAVIVFGLVQAAT